jgi:sulfotransferase
VDRDKKDLFFLAGLPRSGSTLLMSLLNQHPDIYCSPHSGLISAVWALENSYKDNEHISLAPIDNYKKSVEDFAFFFYRDIEKRVIIDKNFAWCTPKNFQAASVVSPNPKMIVLYRPILEILASFVSAIGNQKDNVYERSMEEIDFLPRYYLSRNDAIAEYLMTKEALFEHSLWGLSNTQNLLYANNFLVMSYDELVTDTVTSLQKVFDFLEVDSFTLDLENIVNPHLYNDSVLGINGLHSVRKKISKVSVKPEDFFSRYILDKYDNALEKMGLV